MDIKAYISSGILELYVYGSLSEKESQEVYKVLQEYPEVVEEVERIEKTLQQLSSVMVSPNIDSLYNKIESQLEQPTDIDKVVPINRSSKNWAAYIDWAASVA